METGNNKLEELQEALSPLRSEIVGHPVFSTIKSLEQLQCFMEHHVFAVWDFMSLLKYLQRHCSCVDVPWVPTGDPTVRRLVNDIVLGEESDSDAKGGFASHYELYVSAMEQAGASTSSVRGFVSSISLKTPLNEALSQAGVPTSVQSFVNTTFDIIESNQPHVVAAAFTFGREDLIPDMFTSLIEDLEEQFPATLDLFVYYLNRHIELDSDEHGPMALTLVSLLCEDDDEKWNQARESATASLNARCNLWNAVLEKIRFTP